MTDFRFVTDDFAVSPQISTADVAVAAARGFSLIVNNRPDGEAPGQPAGAAIEAAALAAGLDYLHIPVTGRPSAEQVEAMRKGVDGARGKVLAYCRSGTRSIVTWALGQDAHGGERASELLRLGAAAGYDLSAILSA
ncbi:MAG TPA: TIGR01244 family sulfur transferase [Caulobacteraceae bacterium]|nr:TIGR01244 family sulfur transferase [Caulobacteraceae bacterium]